MVKYNVHVCGSVEDEKTGFACGFDLTVTNGGNAANVGTFIQEGIDKMMGIAAHNKELADAEAKSKPVEGK